MRSSASAAIETAERLAPCLTHGMLHGDPAPEAFLAMEGDIGLIDWGAACHGPLLYDVASAWRDRGFDGCWVLALGTNEAANVSAGSNYSLESSTTSTVPARPSIGRTSARGSRRWVTTSAMAQTAVSIAA